MMTPQDDEIVPSRKWRWFKKSEKGSKLKKQEFGEQEQKVNSFMEELFQDPLEESTSDNLQHRNRGHKDTLLRRASSLETRSLCESLLNDLLIKILESKGFVGEGESRSLNRVTNIKDKLVSRDTSAEGSAGVEDCQGCGTEQVLIFSGAYIGLQRTWWT